MREELEQRFVKAFPNLYADVGGNEQETCMHYGIGVGDGWFDLLWECSAKIEAEILRMPVAERHNFKAAQVKEKFGGLRFYMTSHGNPAIDDAISEAERKSYRTCEHCGLPGEERDGGWVKVLCDSCHEKNEQNRAQRRAAEQLLYKPKEQ